MEYTTVSSPVWYDAAHTMITCDVLFPSVSKDPLTFVASPKDGMAHGRQIYTELIAGKYGVIAEAAQ